jgi:restriction endonuclease
MKPEEYGLDVSVEVITPEQAQAYLNNNHKHREIKVSKVEKLAGAMMNEAWELNGKTIVFDADGVLLNGQHRLAAAVLANKSITTLVVRGIKKEAILGKK